MTYICERLQVDKASGTRMLRVESLGLKVEGLEFRDESLEFRVYSD